MASRPPLVAVAIAAEEAEQAQMRLRHVACATLAQHPRYTYQRVARAAGVSRQTLYKWMEDTGTQRPPTAG